MNRLLWQVWRPTEQARQQPPASCWRCRAAEQPWPGKASKGRIELESAGGLAFWGSCPTGWGQQPGFRALRMAGVVAGLKSRSQSRKSSSSTREESCNKTMPSALNLSHAGSGAVNCSTSVACQLMHGNSQGAEIFGIRNPWCCAVVTGDRRGDHSLVSWDRVEGLGKGGSRGGIALYGASADRVNAPGPGVCGPPLGLAPSGRYQMSMLMPGDWALGQPRAGWWSPCGERNHCGFVSQWTRASGRSRG